MTQTGSDTALLAVTLVGRDGKRRYDSQYKLRLIEACMQPGVSVAGLALKAGVNANLLRRWISCMSNAAAPQGRRILSMMRRHSPCRWHL
ncbi:transposase [Caballeronia sp. ATUFL_M2_KS44]|uniref:transposase n=1 Tax=Caballeronia sp. ATUFL_M2_KS44 TaxID=2921767 RepID=UPI0020289A76|nr:transposase [Caballeronia sp. ATUFL_M2_KS44]